jgi:prepilin-type N-terminal cleavage/methylation domain-containing protein
MRRRLLAAPAFSAPLLPRAGRGEDAVRGFSMTELLVAVSIVLVLMTLVGGGVSAARGAQKKQATQALIAKLDQIITKQLEVYSVRHVSSARLDEVPGLQAIPDKAAARAWYIRRNIITADLPDRWSDVEYLANHTDYLNPALNAPPQFPQAHLTAAQRAYIGIWRSFTAGQRQTVGDTYAGAECLFMIIMQGGIANCLDCAAITSAHVGDKDGDGAPEFHDAWGNPIGYLLWPAAVELPPGSGAPFFSGTRQLFPPIQGGQLASRPVSRPDGTLLTLSPTLGMRPLIYSAGPNGEYGFERENEASNLQAGGNPAGRGCGDWNSMPCQTSGRPTAGNGVTHAADNITNFDDEAKR